MDPLEALFAENRKCSSCRLREGCQQVVPGEGPPKTRIAFIGEAPGRHEDEQGRPFIGRAGGLLRREMRRNNIPEKSVFIGNILCCRPPENRDPKPDEVDACYPWLLKKLQILNPKIVVTLGKPAISTLAHRLGFSSKTKQLSIHALAGRPVWVKERGFYVLPMFHPAYALRRRSVMSEFIASMAYLGIAIPGWLARK